MNDGCVRDDDEHDDDYANNNDAFLPHTIAQNFTSCCVCVCLYVCRFAHTGLVCPEAAATSPHLVLPLASRGVYVLLEIRGARAGGRR